MCLHWAYTEHTIKKTWKTTKEKNDLIILWREFSLYRYIKKKKEKKKKKDKPTAHRNFIAFHMFTVEILGSMELNKACCMVKEYRNDKLRNV